MKQTCTRDVGQLPHNQKVFNDLITKIVTLQTETKSAGARKSIHKNHNELFNALARLIALNKNVVCSAVYINMDQDQTINQIILSHGSQDDDRTTILNDFFNVLYESAHNCDPVDTLSEYCYKQFILRPYYTKKLYNAQELLEGLIKRFDQEGDDGIKYKDECLDAKNTLVSLIQNVNSTTTLSSAIKKLYQFRKNFINVEYLKYTQELPSETKSKIKIWFNTPYMQDNRLPFNNIELSDKSSKILVEIHQLNDALYGITKIETDLMIVKNSNFINRIKSIEDLHGKINIVSDGYAHCEMAIIHSVLKDQTSKLKKHYMLFSAVEQELSSIKSRFDLHQIQENISKIVQDLKKLDSIDFQKIITNITEYYTKAQNSFDLIYKNNKLTIKEQEAGKCINICTKLMEWQKVLASPHLTTNDLSKITIIAPISINTNAVSYFLRCKDLQRDQHQQLEQTTLKELLYKFNNIERAFIKHCTTKDKIFPTENVQIADLNNLKTKLVELYRDKDQETLNQVAIDNILQKIKDIIFNDNHIIHRLCLILSVEEQLIQYKAQVEESVTDPTQKQEIIKLITKCSNFISLSSYEEFINYFCDKKWDNCYSQTIQNLYDRVQTIKKFSIFIGVSKLTCTLCHEMLQLLNDTYHLDIQVSGTHNKLYKRWMSSLLAYESSEGKQLIEHMIQLLAKQFQQGNLTKYLQQREVADSITTRSNADSSSADDIRSLSDSDISTGFKIIKILHDINYHGKPLLNLNIKYLDKMLPIELLEHILREPVQQHDTQQVDNLLQALNSEADYKVNVLGSDPDAPSS